jgi:hypothetical protein
MDRGVAIPVTFVVLALPLEVRARQGEREVRTRVRLLLSP